MLTLIFLGTGVGLAFLTDAGAPTFVSLLAFLAGLAGSILSAWLSVHFWKTRDSANYEAGMLPTPDGKTVPIWVSFLNLGSWGVMAYGVTLFIRHF